MIRPYYILSFIALLFASVAIAYSNNTLQVGDAIPEDFSAINIGDGDHSRIEYSDISGTNGTILLFIRSAEWCKYCKEQLREWNDVDEKFAKAGYNVVSISYDAAEKIIPFKTRNNISYAMLSDTHSRQVKAFGILNTNFSQDSRFYGIPNPTIYIVDTKGNITHRFEEEEYRDRPDISLVAQSLGVSLGSKEDKIQEKTVTPAQTSIQPESATSPAKATIGDAVATPNSVDIQSAKQAEHESSTPVQAGKEGQ